jgi:hypothetical protein
VRISDIDAFLEAALAAKLGGGPDGEGEGEPAG